MSRISRLAVVAVFGVALMVPALAAAHPGQRSFGQTFPYASRLCQRTANGHAPKSLAGSVPAVVTDCTTLTTAFTDAQNVYSTTTGPLKTAAVLALKTLHQTCVAARAAGTPKVCRAARQTTRVAIKSLRQQVAVAASAFRTSVQAARVAFWATIHSLKGGAAIPADPTVGPAPTTAMPSDSQVATS
jgi:hypothetical protein